MNALVPYNDIERMGSAIAKSGLFGIKTPEQAIALMLIAQAEGMHPAIAARDYHVISNRPTLKADAMLARCRPLLDMLNLPRPGGVLVKAVKPGQDRRADLPTIGPNTLRNAAAAGLAGIAYDSGGTILAERDTCIALADELGLFLLGVDPHPDPGETRS